MTLKTTSLECRQMTNALAGLGNCLMYMPAGRHTITPSSNGKPVTIEVEVNAATAEAVEAQRKAIEARTGNKTYFSITHDAEVAGFWPSRFVWDTRLNAKGEQATGVWAEGEWSKSGAEAVEGKDFRSFSPVFHVNAEIEPTGAVRYEGGKAPATVVCASHARLNMGALENAPAFRAISPLWAREAELEGAGFKGNQHLSAKAKEATELAEKASEIASKYDTAETHAAAEKAHMHAAKAHFEDESPDKAEYHQGKSKEHAKSCAVCSAKVLAAEAANQSRALHAQDAGASSGQTNQTNTSMNDQEKAELQAARTKLEQRIAELEAKDDTLSKAELRASRAELDKANLEMQIAEQKERNTELEAAEKARKVADAKAAVKLMVERGTIPIRDLEAQTQWETDFVANPSLIARMTALPGQPALQASGKTPTGTAKALEYGSVKPGPVVVLKHMAELCASQGKIKGQDESACIQRNRIAVQFADVYRDEIRAAAAHVGQAPGINPAFKGVELSAAADTDYLGTLSGTLVAQRTLELFKYDLPLIGMGGIATDFSDMPAYYNQTINTRKIVVPSVQTYSATADTDGRPLGWSTASAAYTVDVNVTMDTPVGVPIPISATTLASTARRLFDEAAPAASYALTKYFINKIYAICTVANFNAYATVTAADSTGVIKVPIAYPNYAVGVIDFARSKVADIEAAFDANEVPSSNRTLLLNPQYYAKLSTDPSLVTFFAGQQAPEIVTDAILPKMCGFTPMKAGNFPATTNRVGFAMNKNALIAATRQFNDYTQILPGASYGSVTAVTDPETGITMTLIQYVNHTRGFAEWLLCVIMGAAKGDSRAGLVITSA